MSSVTSRLPEVLRNDVKLGLPHALATPGSHRLIFRLVLKNGIQPKVMHSCPPSPNALWSQLQLNYLFHYQVINVIDDVTAISDKISGCQAKVRNKLCSYSCCWQWLWEWWELVMWSLDSWPLRSGYMATLGLFKPLNFHSMWTSVSLV